MFNFEINKLDLVSFCLIKTGIMNIQEKGVWNYAPSSERCYSSFVTCLHAARLKNIRALENKCDGFYYYITWKYETQT